jgi:membrane protein
MGRRISRQRPLKITIEGASMGKIDQTVHGIRQLIPRWDRFLNKDIWAAQFNGKSEKRGWGIRRLIFIFYLSFWRFTKDNGTFKASALTFYTLLSIVPVAAMAFGVAHGFGFEKRLESLLLENFSGQEAVVERVIVFSKALLENTKGGLIAGVGLILLFWSVIKLLGNIEYSFNGIWEIKKQRPLGRKFSDYLSIMLISPVLVLVSSSVTVFITTRIASFTEGSVIIGYFSPVITVLLKWIPYGLIWILFTFVYKFMPNTKVSFISALFGGIIAGSAYQIIQFLYINFQVDIAKYNAIYGSFAALPLFLVWLQLSWFIVLIGAELSYAHQNAATYAHEPDRLEMSHAFKRQMALLIMHLLATHFRNHGAPLTKEDIAGKLQMPYRLAQQVIENLLEARIVSEVVYNDRSANAYQPAIDITKLTVHFLITALDRSGSDNIPVIENEVHASIRKVLESFSNQVEHSDSNCLIVDLVR